MVNLCWWERNLWSWFYTPGSTRKLYEKKVYEYETERTKLPSPGGTVSYTGEESWARNRGKYSCRALNVLPDYVSCALTEPSTSESYVRETFISPQSRENLSYGREGEASLRENGWTKLLGWNFNSKALRGALRGDLGNRKGISGRTEYLGASRGGL